MKLQKKFFLSVLFLSFALVFSLVSLTGVFAQTATPSPTDGPTPSPTPATSTVGDCASKNLNYNDCVNYYQNKVNDAQSQEKTLSSQITVMDSQIKLTEARIAATKQ